MVHLQMINIINNIKIKKQSHLKNIPKAFSFFPWYFRIFTPGPYLSLYPPPVPVQFVLLWSLSILNGSALVDTLVHEDPTAER